MAENPYKAPGCEAAPPATFSRRFLSWLTSGITPQLKPFCSFCGKSHRIVGPLVEGRGKVFICQSCIPFCNDILELERLRRAVLQGGTPMPNSRARIDNGVTGEGEA